MEEKTETKIGQAYATTDDNGINSRIIFKMSWFDTKRHSVPHTMMYFALLEDTFWGLDGDWCGGRITRITVIKVLENSSEYESEIRKVLKSIVICILLSVIIGVVSVLWVAFKLQKNNYRVNKVWEEEVRYFKN